MTIITREVNISAFIREWERLHGHKPTMNLLIENGNAAVAAMKRLCVSESAALKIDEKGNPVSALTISFFRAVNRAHGEITTTAQAVKEFPFAHPPETLEQTLIALSRPIVSAAM